MMYLSKCSYKKEKNFTFKKDTFLKKNFKKSFAPVFIKNYKSTNSKFFFSSFLKKKNQEIYYKLKNFEISIIGSPSKNGKKAKPEEILETFIKNKKDLFFYNGAWVIFIYDNFGEKLFIFRDYVGLKPFYYTEKDKCLFFSSSLGLLSENGFSNRYINYNFLNFFIHCHPKSTFGRNETIYKDVKTFSPMKYLEISSDMNIKKKQLYNEDSFNLNNFKNINKKENFVKNIYRVMKQTLSDKNNKKITTSSSGGIDSAIILYNIKKILKTKRFESFTVAFNKKYNYDETDNAKLLSKKFADKHNIINIDYKDLILDLKDMYNYLDVPVSTASIYGYYFLNKKIAKKKKNLIISGYAGNNLNAGFYPSYLFNFLDIQNKRILKDEIDCWIKLHNTKKNPKSLKLFKNFTNFHYDKKIKGKILDKIFYLTKKHLLAKKIPRRKIRKNDELLNFGNYLKSFHYYAILNDSIVLEHDAANSIEWINNIETLSPLIDKSLIAYGFSQTRKNSIHKGLNRIKIRKDFNKLIPDKILHNVSTEGFKLPTNTWFAKEMRNFITNMINSKKFKNMNIFNHKNLQKIFNDHFNEKKDYSMLIWQIINFYLWSLKWKPKF